MIGFASIAIGLSMMLMFLLLACAWQELPPKDRRHQDRPPWLVRALWPIIRLTETYLMPRRIQSGSSRLQRELLAAGLDHTLSPLEFRALQCVAVAMALFIGLLIPEPLGMPASTVLLLIALIWPKVWLKRLKRERNDALVRALPYYIDVILLALDAGSNLMGGITLALKKNSDSPLRQEFGRVLRDVRAGLARGEALQAMAERTDCAAVRRVVSSVLQAERSGSSLSPVLKSHAEQLRKERFHRAEKQAMEAPVRLLLPLVLFIFPSTFFVVGFVLLNRSAMEGVMPLPWVSRLLGLG